MAAVLGLLVVAFTVAGCGNSGVNGPTERLEVEVVGRRPHDVTAYTQGLVLSGERLFESTGLFGESTLREVDPHTGEVLRQIELDERYFGEGLAAVDDRLIQLTWHEGTALTYRVDDLTPIGNFTYESEGWGLCDDGSRLVMSDGSSTLYFRDRQTFELQDTLAVLSGETPVDQLNELECVDDAVYANVYQTTDIVRIDAATGHVTAVIDASRFLDEPGTDAGVMNGIAYDSDAGTFLVTGKNWPTLFEVRFVPAA